MNWPKKKNWLVRLDLLPHPDHYTSPRFPLSIHTQFQELESILNISPSRNLHPTRSDIHCRRRYLFDFHHYQCNRRVVGVRRIAMVSQIVFWIRRKCITRSSWFFLLCFVSLYTSDQLKLLFTLDNRLIWQFCYQCLSN